MAAVSLKKPDGTPQKLLDVSKLRGAGWEASIGMREGLESTVAWYREHAADLREVGSPRPRSAGGSSVRGLHRRILVAELDSVATRRLYEDYAESASQVEARLVGALRLED